MTSEALVRRDSDGRWSTGSSEVVKLARSFTEEAVLTLREIAVDEKQPAMARVRAADVLLARGWGSPSSEVDLELAERTEEETAKVFTFQFQMGEPAELEAEDGDFEDLSAS